jgi:hypothetical protein
LAGFLPAITHSLLAQLTPEITGSIVCSVPGLPRVIGTTTLLDPARPTA